MEALKGTILDDLVMDQYTQLIGRPAPMPYWSFEQDEVLYEVKASSENWMIAGRKRGHVILSHQQGLRVEISVLCLTLVAGYLRPPQLGLPDVDKANISCNPPGPHLVKDLCCYLKMKNQMGLLKGSNCSCIIANVRS